MTSAEVAEYAERVRRLRVELNTIYSEVTRAPDSGTLSAYMSSDMGAARGALSGLQDALSTHAGRKLVVELSKKARAESS